MNDWYIDRSKNFINSSLESVITFLSNYSGKKDSSSLISSLANESIFDLDSGNLNAALTRFRDHGIINNNNELGDSARDYFEKRLSRNELIIDLFLKRPVTKKNSVNLKPLILLCKFFDIMYEIAADENDVYLTFEECFKYLYPCNNLSEITFEFVDAIISNRSNHNEKVTMKQNDITNLSIWFNALRSTPIFIATEERTIIRPNYYAKSFLKFISINGFRISETPTNSNTNLYNYYCDRNTGISEIIPSVFKPNVIVKSIEESKVIFDYIFGINRIADFDYGQYFTFECFGVYNSMIFLPRLAIRKVWIENKSIGNSLFSIINNVS